MFVLILRDKISWLSYVVTTQRAFVRAHVVFISYTPLLDTPLHFGHEFSIAFHYYSIQVSFEILGTFENIVHRVVQQESSVSSLSHATTAFKVCRGHISMQSTNVTCIECTCPNASVCRRHNLHLSHHHLSLFHQHHSIATTTDSFHLNIAS